MGLVLAACTASAADPALLAHVPPDSKVFLGASLSRFLASPSARSLVDQAQTAQPQVRDLMQSAGFDPFKDMQELLLASTGTPKADSGVVLIRGAFDPARLAALAAKSGAFLTTYGGVQVLTGKQPSDSWFALLDGTTAAIGDPQTVKGVIDRRGAGGPAARLRGRIEELSNAYDFWLVSAAPVSSLPASAPVPQLGGLMQGDILQAVLEASGGIRFGPDLLVSLEAVSRSEKDAAALADVIRFFVGMAQLSAQKDAQGAEAIQFLQRLQLTVAGNATRMTLSIPQGELDKLVQRAQAIAKQQILSVPGGQSRPAPSGGLTIQSSPRDMGTVTVR